MMSLIAGHLANRFGGIDLLYRFLSNPETRSQLEFFLSIAPEGDLIRMNGNLNPFTVQHRPAVQVFWPVAGAHSELNSRSAYYAPEEWREVRIPVPAWKAHPAVPGWSICSTRGAVRRRSASG